MNTKDYENRKHSLWTEYYTQQIITKMHFIGAREIVQGVGHMPYIVDEYFIPGTTYGLPKPVSSDH